MAPHDGAPHRPRRDSRHAQQNLNATDAEEILVLSFTSKKRMHRFVEPEPFAFLSIDAY